MNEKKLKKQFKNKIRQEIYERLERAIDTLVNDDEKMSDLVMLTSIIGRITIKQLESLNRYHELIEELAIQKTRQECEKKPVEIIVEKESHYNEGGKMGAKRERSRIREDIEKLPIMHDYYEQTLIEVLRKEQVLKIVGEEKKL